MCWIYFFLRPTPSFQSQGLSSSGRRNHAENADISEEVEVRKSAITTSAKWTGAGRAVCLTQFQRSRSREEKQYSPLITPRAGILGKRGDSGLLFGPHSRYAQDVLLATTVAAVMPARSVPC
jgi:hypothetical protein